VWNTATQSFDRERVVARLTPGEPVSILVHHRAATSLVPGNACAEGSYGSSQGVPAGVSAERPVGTAVCSPSQVVGACVPRGRQGRVNP
jgi:hypothetical protein